MPAWAFRSGLLAVQTGRPELAVTLMDRATGRNDTIPEIPEIHFHVGIACGCQALALTSGSDEPHYNITHALADEKRLDEAATC